MDVPIITIYVLDRGTFGPRFVWCRIDEAYTLTDLSKSAVGKQDITCMPVELVTLEPPSGQSCGNYMQNYISMAGGYLTNLIATSGCEFCSVRTTDQFLGPNFNIEYSHHWRNFGFMMVFILFYVSFLMFHFAFVRRN
jgi:ATP-binding cassette, subfamily G (WHITE), member 2, SNQ2